MWPGFNPGLDTIMWVAFVDLLLCSKRFLACPTGVIETLIGVYDATCEKREWIAHQ